LTLEECNLINFAVIGEGKHDSVFLHEVIVSNLQFSVEYVCHYEKPSIFQRDMANGRQKRISVTCDNGYELPLTVCKLVEDFWYCQDQDCLLVVGDTDRGKIYNKLAHRMDIYINGRRPKPYVNPILTLRPEEEKLTIGLRKGRIVTVWTADVPDSLEIQISKILKANYKWIPKKLNEDQTMELASKKLGISMEQLIRQSVGPLSNLTWFKHLCEKMKKIVPAG
jgi:hypothetical protein